MAVVTQPRKGAMIMKKPVMLKDYLMDDLNSCSSNGFKSFPRRQCCTTVRFLLEIDLKSSHNNINNLKSKTTPKQLLLRRSRSRDAAANTLSALQRASGAVINAVRSLQFHSGKSTPSNNARKGGLVLLLPRSISRRIWRNKSINMTPSKVEEEKVDVGRWRSFRELLEDRDEPSDQTTVRSNSTDDNKSNSESWGESEFSLNSESSNSVGSHVAEGKSGSEKVSGGVGVTKAGEESIETPTTAATKATSTSTCCSPQTAKVWMNKDEEKEQFSPVSVLDCPFEDEDEESSSSNSSPFRSRLALMEGAQHKFKPKIRRFENLSQLEPIDLETRMAMSDIHDEEERDNKSDPKAVEVVKQLIIKTSDSILSSNLALMKAEKLVTDLFIDTSVKHGEENVTMVEEVLKVAEEWLNGEKQMLSSWEVENGRQIYLSDMDNKYCGKWMKLDEQEQEVGLELEVEVWNSLLNEFVLDLVN